MIAALLLQLAAAPLPPAPDSVPVITLAEALERSVRLDPDYVRALGSVSEAEWGRKAARLAFLLPSVGVSLDYTKYSKAFFNIGTFDQSSTSSTFSADARYEVFSARKFAELGRSQAELEAASATEVQRRYAAALFTESAYYAVLADEELARVARERATRAEEQLRLARARVASGAAVQSDSLTVRLELLRARVERLRAESALRVSRLELGRRIGIDGPAGAAPLEAEPPEALPLSLAAAVQEALDQGPEYRAVRARERAARAVLKARRGAYLPTLTLAASHQRFDVQLFPSASNVSAISLTLSLPIWDNGQRELAIVRARSDQDVARAVRADLERAALRDVTEAYDQYETARAAVDLAAEGVVLARENYRVQEARYQAGATTVLDLISVQNDLSEADAGLVQARYVARLGIAQLEAILGRRIVSINGGGQ